MRKWDIYGLDQFLDDYKLMSIRPYNGDDLVLAGIFEFKASCKSEQAIEDSYNIEIIVPKQFPRELPKVRELNRRIPPNKDHHINSDGTLCLGYSFNLIDKVHNHPTLSGFARHCLVPYLYAMSLKLDYNKDFIFGELHHGEQGAIEDCMILFGLENREQVVAAMVSLGTKKRVANKRTCPCGCKKRLGQCRFHYKLNRFRKMASRSWFNMRATNIGQVM